MKTIFILSLLLVSSSTLAFTLNNNFGASFKNNNVKVRIAGNTTCTGLGLRVDELDSLINPAINSFWNKVSTSSLRLSKGSHTQAIANIEDGLLCPPTDLDCIGQGNTIPPVKDIIISCNNNSVNFSNSTNVLAVTVPNNFSKNSIVGAVILINDKSMFSTLSRSDQISVIAHEIGHAIGLGHSKDDASLMFFRTVDHREKLGQDDVDGVSYLYPVKMDACGLLGTIEETKTPPFMTTLGALAIMILMIECLKLFNRSKRSSAL